MSNRHRMNHWAPVAALMVSLTAESAEWSAEPGITLRGQYDDNYRLTAAAHDDVWGAILDPHLKLSRRSELWDLSASGRLRAARYTGEEGLNTVDNFFDLALKRQLERGSLDASASLVNDTTLQDEFLDSDTGLVIDQVDRSQRELRLAGEYMFTEATWLELSAGLTRVEYDDGERFGLLNYDYLTPSLRVVHQYDPQTQVFGILSHSDVEYDSSSEFESKTDSLQLGASYDFTETWKVSASIGSRRTKTSSLVPTAVPVPGLEAFFPALYNVALIPRDTDSTGLVYDASLTRKFESGDLKLTASQSVTPSSTGTDIESLKFSLNGNHRFSAKLSAALAVSYYQSSTVGDVTTSADNDRFRISPSLSWRLDEYMTLNTGYTYTRVQRDVAADQTADSNAVFISLGYTWPRMAVSR